MNIWSTGITVKHCEDGWLATCKWQGGEYAQSGYVEGKIATNCELTLEQAINSILNVFESMNIKRSDEIDEMKDRLGFALYYDDKVEHTKDELKQIRKEALKRGWQTY